MKLRITYNAPVVLTFTLAAVVVFVLTQAVTGLRPWFAAYPKLGDAHAYVGLVTHVLGHANWEHLLGNFMFILLVGPILEERYGSLTLLVMILVTAVATGFANLAFSSNMLMGASGVVMMMILLASMVNVRAGEIPLTFIAVALIRVGGELVHAFDNDGISHMAHLVGAAVGGAFGFLAAGKRAAPQAVAPKSPLKLDKKVG